MNPKKPLQEGTASATRMGRDNKRHPNGTVLIEPRSSAKPISEAPVPLLAAVIPVVLAPAAPPVVLLATWDITVPHLLAEPLNALALGASEAVCSECLAAALTAISLVVLLATLHSSKKISRWVLLAELFLADALLARLALGIVCLAAIPVLLATSSRWVLLAVVFLAQARGARLALGVVCPAARKWFAATSILVLLATLHSSKKIRWVLLAVLFLAYALLTRLAFGIVCLAAIVVWRCCVLLATWCTQKIPWVLPAELFLAYALGAREALGIVCLAANWWSRLLNTQGLSLRRQDNHAEEEPHEEVLFGFPIGGCFHPSAGVTDWSGRFLVGYFLCL